MMIICELHGLNEIALDTLVRFRGELSGRIDVDQAIDLLADPGCRVSPVTTELESRLKAAEATIEKIMSSSSWRVTAPMRAFRRRFG